MATGMGPDEGAVEVGRGEEGRLDKVMEMAALRARGEAEGGVEVGGSGEAMREVVELEGRGSVEAGGLPPLARKVRVAAREAMVVARAFVRDQFRTPRGYLGLWSVNGDFWVWSGGRWQVQGADWVENRVWRWTENAVFTKQVRGGTLDEPIAPDLGFVKNVVRALQAICERKWTVLPAWTSMTGMEPDARLCVGFRNGVVSAAGGELRVWERDELWVDNVMVPCDWNPEARCERWERALDEWSQGDQKWKDLAQVIMGMALVSERRWAWLVWLYGVSRSGKGTFVHVMRKLLGGQAWFSTSVEEVTGSFGLDGIANTRVFSVPEYRKNKAVQGAFERIVKEVVSQEEMVVNMKNIRQVRVRPTAMPVIQSNGLPELANENQGISTKIVILPFVKTYKDSPQLNLAEELEGELEGIAAWAMRGVVRLVKEGAACKVVTDAAREALLKFRTEGNVWESFLESRYERVDTGVEKHEDVWMNWREYLDRVGWRGEEAHVTSVWFGKKLCEKSTWQLERGRKVLQGEEGPEQVRVIKGLRRKRVPNDTLEV